MKGEDSITLRAFACAAFILLVLSGCGSRSDVAEVSLDKKAPQAAERSRGSARIRVAVGGMITPKQGFVYYKRFIDYIGRKTGQRVEYVDREDYAEINRLIKNGYVDVAFVCGGPYVDGRKDLSMELLAAPEAYGAPVYYSYIIVHKEGDIRDLEGLRGRKFAFTDPLSNTGRLVPTYMLSKIGETPEKFFSKYVYLKSHDRSIKAVAQKIVDGAAVDSLIWEYANRTNPEYTSATKVIVKSPPYGIPPVVVRTGLSPEWKEKLRKVFLEAHSDPEGREILKLMMVDRFVDIEDTAYDSIRAMKRWVDVGKPKP